MIDVEDFKIDYHPIQHGQKYGTPKGMKISHEKSGITITIDYCRNPYAARQLLINMLEEALTDPLVDKVL